MILWVDTRLWVRMKPEIWRRIQDFWNIPLGNMQICCDTLSLNVTNGDGFEYYGYDDGVGVGGECGGFVWEGVVCVCKICVGDVPNLSKWMVCESVVESVISVTIYDSFIWGGICGDWDGTWVARGLCYLGVDDCSIDRAVLGTCL